MQSQSLNTPRLSNIKTPTFEFTKRKRWADLLVSELTEAILLVLSADCHILYCGAAVTELLGWRDDELVDGDLADLINLDDRARFQTGFREAIEQRAEMLAYTRLRCKSEFVAHQNFSVEPKEVLFEINGYAHYIDGDNDCKCFFAVAKPYPSRNTAVLNTFLELKMENEYLQQRLSELKLGTTANSTPTSIAGPSASILRYDGVTASMASQMSIRPPLPRPNLMPPSSSLVDYATMTYSATPIHDDILPSPTTRNFDSTGFKERDDEGNSEPSRKKQRKMFSTEQHVCVTCGRTDSPEWRKGPMGPKTLCNACGLRWAKKMRKFDDNTEGGGPQDTIQPQFA